MVVIGVVKGVIKIDVCDMNIHTDLINRDISSGGLLGAIRVIRGLLEGFYRVIRGLC